MNSGVKERQQVMSNALYVRQGPSFRNEEREKQKLGKLRKKQ